MLKLIVVGIYVVVMLLVGYWCMRRTRTVSDFFLGDRALGPWLSAFAYGTTYFSAVLFIGYAGKLGWGFGIHTMWIVVGNAIVGSMLAWMILGARTRTMTGRLNAMTMPEFLAVRFQSPFMKLVAALIIFIFLVPYSASVYMGLSYLFQLNMNIKYEYALGFMAALTGIYLIMGGYLALAITDFIRGILELGGVIILVVFLANKQGGFVHATQQLMDPAFAPGLKAPPIPFIGGFSIPGWLTFASLVFLTSFGPWGLPQMVQKFYSIKSKSDIRRAMVVCTIFSFLIAFGAYYTGALTHLFYPTLPMDKSQIDQLMPVFLTKETPTSVSLVLLLLVFSASMSSLSSLVLVSSSALAMDLYAGLINPKAERQKIVTLMRVLCGVFVAISLVIALRKPTYILNLMAISWGVLAGCFLGPYLYGLFWKRTTKAGAIAGMLSGLLISVVLYVRLGDAGIPFSGAVAMIVPMFVVPVVSLVTPQLDPALIARAFEDEPAAAPAAVEPEAVAAAK